MTRAAKHGHRPGAATRQPGSGLGLVGPAWPQRAACAGHPAAMEPATAWEAAFVILAYCDDCPAWKWCDKQRQKEGLEASGVWASQWLPSNTSPKKRRKITIRFHDALAQIATCEQEARELDILEYAATRSIR